jgi:hypothetical protein
VIKEAAPAIGAVMEMWRKIKFDVRSRASEKRDTSKDKER